jgi:hypothetical protein
VIAIALIAAALLPGLPVLGTPPAPAPAPPPQAPPALFAPNSIWNAPLPADAARDSASSRLVSALLTQEAARGPWINTTAFSTPVYRVPSGQSTVRVWIDHPPSSNADSLERQLAHVPIPSGARPSHDSDSRMVVWQASSDTQWELWHVSRRPGGFKPGWHAGWGAVIHNVSQSTGINPRPFGATASGLALMGGLIRLDDVRRGSIDHALALGVPRVTRGVAVAPANRSDGRFSGSNTIPEGTRFRLDPSLNLDSLGLPPATLAIARAAQRYGMIVRDGSGAVSLYAEDPTPTGSNPYPSWFGGQSPAQVMQRFPWSRLEALAPNPGDGTPARKASRHKRHHKRHHHRRRHHRRTHRRH